MVVDHFCVVHKKLKNRISIFCLSSFEPVFQY
nr:MAG TPA: hypothetical protein [Caudoviricetes sp.]DAU54225.1 MAG TPA: hypothetical protein [Bacteriophage sp.]